MVKVSIEHTLTNEDVGRLVRYYDQGWYHGYLRNVNKKGVQIQPIGAKYGKKPHLRTLPIEFVELAE